MPAPLRVDAYNRYMYAMGNPLRYSDPSGHCSDSSQYSVGWTANYSGDSYEDGCDPDWQVYAIGKHPPYLLEMLAPDVVIRGTEGEGSVIATLNGGRYEMWDFENLRKVAVNGFGGGISLPSVSIRRVFGIGYYQSNDPVFEDPDQALAGRANEGSVSGGDGLVVSGSYSQTDRYVDDPVQALHSVKGGVGVGAGSPLNATLGGSRSRVNSEKEGTVQRYENVDIMRSDYANEYGPGPISFLQRFRQPEEERNE